MRTAKQIVTHRARTLLADGGWWGSANAARADFYLLQLMGWGTALALLGYFSAEYGAWGGFWFLVGLSSLSWEGVGGLLFDAAMLLSHLLIVVLVVLLLLLTLFRPKSGHIFRVLLVASVLLIARTAASAFVRGADDSLEIEIWDAAALLPAGLLLFACAFLLRRFKWMVWIASRTGLLRRIVPLFVLGIPLPAPAVLAIMRILPDRRDLENFTLDLLLAEASLILLALLALAAGATYRYRQGQAPQLT